MSEPSVNGSNGRGSDGRVIAGNPGGPGNPQVRQAARLRAALLRAVDEAQLQATAEAILQKAIGGDVSAFKELCDRVLGRPSQSDTLERIAVLEEKLGLVE